MLLSKNQKERMHAHHHLLFLISLLLIPFPNKVHGDPKAQLPFPSSLQILQNQIGYKFKNINFLTRAMTHSSFSSENNRALSILGLYVIETSVSLRSLSLDIDISPKDLSSRITKITELDSCAADGLRLGLENVVRVSVKTNSTMPSVLCTAFRAVFGAVAVDTGKADEAGVVFWNVRGKGGEASAF